MHNHDDGKPGLNMMWMMLPCLLLLGVLFISGSSLASSKYLWLIIIGICIVPHVWMMFKGQGHGKHEDGSDLKAESKTDENDKPKPGSCCH